MHVLQLGSSVRSILNMVLIAVVDAQSKNPRENNAPHANNKGWWSRFVKVTHDM